MGLFGGFKANFISKIKKKHKQDNVVCLKYNVYSEFDTQTCMINSEFANLRAAVVESKQTLPSSVHQHSDINQTKNIEKSKLSKFNIEDNKKKLLNQPQLKPQNYYKVSNVNGDVKTTDIYTNADLKSDKLMNNEHKLLDHTLYSTQILTKDDNYKTVTPEEEYKLKYEDKNIENEKSVCETSTLIFMTQASLETEKNEENGEKNFEINVRAINTPEITTEQRAHKNFKINTDVVESPKDEQEYKINVVQYNFDRSHSISEDELSDHEEEEPKFKFTGYSSQAASIFFGKQTSNKLVMNNGQTYSEEDC